MLDNDGTLWCEKPMPIELGFILGRLAEMVGADPSLRDHQPWKAAAERDYAWLGAAITKHYHGDDEDVKVLMSGILRAFASSLILDRREVRLLLAGDVGQVRDVLQSVIDDPAVTNFYPTVQAAVAAAHKPT